MPREKARRIYERGDKTPCPHCGHALGDTTDTGTVGGRVQAQGHTLTMRGNNERMVMRRIEGLCPSCGEVPRG